MTLWCSWKHFSVLPMCSTYWDADLVLINLLFIHLTRCWDQVPVLLQTAVLRTLSGCRLASQWRVDGGLGVCQVVSLVFPAFSSSAASTCQLLDLILLVVVLSKDHVVDNCEVSWSISLGTLVLSASSSFKQSAWDRHVIYLSFYQKATQAWFQRWFQSSSTCNGFFGT